MDNFKPNKENGDKNVWLRSSYKEKPKLEEHPAVVELRQILGLSNIKENSISNLGENNFNTINSGITTQTIGQQKVALDQQNNLNNDKSYKNQSPRYQNNRIYSDNTNSDKNSYPGVKKIIPSSLLPSMYQAIISIMSKPLGDVFDVTEYDLAWIKPYKWDHCLNQFNIVGIGRDMRLRRPLIQQAFFNQMRNAVGNFIGVKLPQNNNGFEITSINKKNESIGLMDERFLQENLAIDNCINQLRNIASVELDALNDRYMALNINAEITDNPLNIESIVQYFIDALYSEWDISIRWLTIKRFDQVMQSTILDLYKELNSLLINGGVLQNWVSQNKNFQFNNVNTQRSNQNKQNNYNNSYNNYYNNEHINQEKPVNYKNNQQNIKQETNLNQNNIELWGVLSRLLDTARKNIVNHENDQNQNNIVEDLYHNAPDWFKELHAQSIQKEKINIDENLLYSALDSLIDKNIGTSSLSIKSLLENKIKEVKNVNENIKSEVDFGKNEAAIDAVEWMFDFLLKDVQIAEGIRLLLSKLQLPYVRLALSDPSLFVAAHHPARELLNILGELGTGWSQISDKNDLFSKINSCVDSIVKNKFNILETIQFQNNEMNSILTEQQKRAYLSERRLVETLTGKERLEMARERVSSEINTIMNNGNHGLPEWMVALTTRLWAHHSVLVLLKHGEDSIEFSSAIDWIYSIISFASPIKSNETKNMLIGIMADVLRKLDVGLTNVGVELDEKNRILNQVSLYLNQQISNRPMNSSVEINIANVFGTLTPPKGQFGRNTLSKLDDSMALILNSLKPNIWILFQNEYSEIFCGKIAWISNDREKMVIVNPWGHKIADLDLHDFGIQLHQGIAKIFDDRPAFDRMLKALFDKIKDTVNNDGDKKAIDELNKN
jgi:hypothetical protein